MNFSDFIVKEENRVGKRLRDGVYVHAFAIENDESNLKDKEIELYHRRKEQLPKDFVFDFVFIGNDNTIRFMRMNSLTVPHPHVESSYKFDSQGNMMKGRIAKQIYHRMETMISPSHPTYTFHKAVTDWEEANGLLRFDGKTPSGSANIYKQQVETMMPWRDFEAGIEDIKKKFSIR